MTTIDPRWEVSVGDVRRMMDSGLPLSLLDVRQPEEHALCRIDGAHLVPLPELPKRLDEVRRLADGRPVVVHCHHGGRSLEAAAILRQAGLGEVRSMAGGIDAWSLQIDPRVPRY